MSLISAGGAVTGAGAAGGYEIERSLRFNSADSAYLSRTPSTTSNRRTWTWSGWIKRGSANGQFLTAGSTSVSNGYSTVGFAYSETAYVVFYSSSSHVYSSNAIFRDSSAWYHVVYVVDTTQTTTDNRVKLYVNGSQVTLNVVGGYTAVPQNFDCSVNTSGESQIIGAGRNGDGSLSGFHNGYMTEINFIDGQALDASSFGEFNSDTGVWQPKAYTGSYGTNGFYLDFADNASTTTLGYDAAGSNDWTLNNFSVTAGAGNDSLVDSPTRYGTDTGAGGEVRGNYATLNPLANTGIGTLSNGNLTLVTSTNNKTITATMGIPPSGQWYFEITATDYVTDGGTYIGVVNTPFLTSFPANDTWLGILTYNASYNNGTAGDTNNLSQANATQDGDIYCFAIDATNGKFWMGRSRSGTLVWADGVTPSVNGSGATTLALPSGTLYPMAWRGSSFNETYDFNFGQRAFAHTAPSGFKALCTTNLPEPTVADGGDYFNAVLYTGNNSNGKAVTGVGFSPDFIWFKSRSAANGHCLVNRITGVSAGLGSDSTAAEQNPNLASFDSDGFTVNSVVDFSSTNASGNSIVAWNWKANGSGVSNTDGTITSTVSANTDSGFSIVTWSGNGSGSSTVGHGLGVTPSFIIVKFRNAASSWSVYTASLGATKRLTLETTDAEATNIGYWNNTSPTSTVFTLGSALSQSYNYVAYCFAPVAGYSAFGSYTGNGNADGPFVYTGFRPRYVMIKIATGDTGQWVIYDTARDTYNAMDLELQAESSNAENQLGSNPIDCLSNGFKIRSTTLRINRSTSTFIYMAFAENPFKLALAR